MKQILAYVESGDFAREWIAENRAGQENFNACAPSRRPRRLRTPARSCVR